MTNIILVLILIVLLYIMILSMRTNAAVKDLWLYREKIKDFFNEVFKKQNSSRKRDERILRIFKIFHKDDDEQMRAIQSLINEFEEPVKIIDKKITEIRNLCRQNSNNSKLKDTKINAICKNTKETSEFLKGLKTLKR